jgi:DNA invertase Pin-like site-specific DNA recombinase
MRAAIYARFSTDRQNETSIEAQERLCRSRATTLGADVVAVHADQAVSGSVPVDLRPGGKALLADVLAGRVEVVLVESLSRLSRDIGEQDRAVKRIEHRSVRIVGVSDAYDSLAAGRKVLRVARGLVNELYLDDLRAQVHRTLAAKASRGRHVAGLSYGYTSEQDGNDRRLVIVPEQATIVREIFERYGAGESCQRIAADLNARGILGPRRGTWSVSALYGSPDKGAGVLNNELYIGRVVWNRSQWIKHPETGKRERMIRPRAEWLIAEQPELRLVDEAAWQRVRDRFDRRRGEQPPGRPLGGHARTLFGGLLRCGICGGAMIAVSAHQYGCAARKDRGPAVCHGMYVPRRGTDTQLLGALRGSLADGKSINQAREIIAAALNAARDNTSGVEARKRALQREIRNLTDAVAQLGLSEALRERLVNAEAELKALQRRPAADALPSIDDVLDVYRSMLLRITEALAEDVERARGALAQVLGTVIVRDTGQGVWAEMKTRPEAVLLAAGGALTLGSVAGEGFEPSTFGL